VAASSVKNLIFDLGGVILDLAVDDTIHAFSRLSGIEPQQVKKIFVSSPEFNHYEKGEMDDRDFRDFIKKRYKIKSDDSQIDYCWNQMLKGLPLVKLELLKELKRTFRVFLLSNTNGIHLHHINEVILKELTGENDLDQYFHKAYYSHRMKKRKPEPGIYQQIMEDNKLQEAETLFLDDNPQNIESASSLGIQTVLVTHPDVMLTTCRALINSN
jgi:putative hydrolase of the HAD superfamily